MKKKLTAITLVLCLSLSMAVSAYALLYDRSFYDKIAWTWQEYASWDPDYNCLAYSIGLTNAWLWPTSEERNATQNETRLFMASYGYGFTTSNPTILAYGPSSDSIDHFSRKIDSSTSRAKWGALEVMTSYSLDPYYDNDDSYYSLLYGGYK